MANKQPCTPKTHIHLHDGGPQFLLHPPPVIGQGNLFTTKVGTVAFSHVLLNIVQFTFCCANPQHSTTAQRSTLQCSAPNSREVDPCSCLVSPLAVPRLPARRESLPKASPASIQAVVVVENSRGAEQRSSIGLIVDLHRKKDGWARGDKAVQLLLKALGIPKACTRVPCEY